MAKEKEFEIFEELLASDQLNAYQNFAGNITAILGDNPTLIWEQLKYNPWMAMAIYDDMEEKDGKIFSCLETRREGVLSKGWSIVPASDEKQDIKIAEFVEETLTDYFGSSNSLESADEFDFNSFLSEALEAVSRGMSIGEIIFENGKDRVYIKEVKFKPQQLFSFGDTALAEYSTNSMMYPQTGRLRLRSGVMSGEFALNAELPEYKFFTFSYRPRFGNRWGNPLLRKVFWQSWIKRNSIKSWLRYQEKGSGVVIAKYNDGSSEAEQQEAVDTATAIQEESAVAVPKKFLLEVHEMVRNIGSSHKELVKDFCNSEMAQTLLGQTLTSQGSDGGGGARALGEVHERVKDDKVEVDSIALQGPVNKSIVKAIVYFNFGPNARHPKFKINYEQKENQDSRIKLYSTLSKDVGMPLSKSQIRGDFQVDEPIDDEDRLGGSSENSTDKKQTKVEVSEFAEKKTLKMKNYGNNLERKSNSKTERFRSLRPSMIEFLDE